VARYMQDELGSSCIVERWDQNVFEPGGYALDSLLRVADACDFAVLVATPDDVTSSRGQEAPSARDNVILEFGLFLGRLGRERTYLLATGDLRLPTDVLGVTRLPYGESDDIRRAIAPSALKLEERFHSLGRRAPGQGPAESGDEAPRALRAELALLCRNAQDQGWFIRTDSPTALRLRSPRQKQFTLTKGKPEATRQALRPFAARLKASGLRVSSVLLRPVSDSPF
jgi:hypothetical protein